MKSNTPSIKTSSAAKSGGGVIKSAMRQISGRDGKVKFLNKSSNEAESQDGVIDSSELESSDKGDYSKERDGVFASRLIQSNNKLAFRRMSGLGGGAGGAFVGSVGSSSGLGISSSGSWGGSGAVASSDPIHGLEGQYNQQGGHRPPSGTAVINQEDVKLLEGGKGDGHISVLNSTLSAFVSWMTERGNYLTQTLVDEVVNGGKALGQVFNEIYNSGGRNVGGNSQTLNVNGNKLDDSFGKEGNKASHAVFLADLTHSQHGHMFNADAENFRKVALASGVPADKIKIVNNWADYKREIAIATQNADSMKASNPDAQLGLLTGTAAHGYSFGGQGSHDPNAESGFHVNNMDVREKQIEDLLGLADAHFNNTLMINCPCHSGGFDGKTDLVAEGRLNNSLADNKKDDPKKPKEDKLPEKLA